MNEVLFMHFPIFLVGGDLDLKNEKELNHARPKQSQYTSPGEREVRVHIEFIGGFNLSSISPGTYVKPNFFRCRSLQVKELHY